MTPEEYLKKRKISNEMNLMYSVRSNVVGGSNVSTSRLMQEYHDYMLNKELIAYTKHLFKDDTTQIDLEFVDDYLSERSKK